MNACKHFCSECMKTFDCRQQPAECREGGRWSTCDSCMEQLSAKRAHFENAARETQVAAAGAR